MNQFPEHFSNTNWPNPNKSWTEASWATQSLSLIGPIAVIIKEKQKQKRKENKQ